jgi:mannan endo-1,4-beta-mannosidase
MKTAASQLLLAGLALGLAVPRGGRQHHGISKDDFIRVDGLRLYDSKGALHYLTGTFQIRITTAIY